METKILTVFSFCRPRSGLRYSDLATWGPLPVIQECEGTTFVRPGWCFFPATNQADKQVLFLAGACGCPLKICDIENWMVYIPGLGTEWFKEKCQGDTLVFKSTLNSPTPASRSPSPAPPKKERVCRIKRALLFCWRGGGVNRDCKNEVERISRLRDLRYTNCSHKTPLICSYWHFYTWVIALSPPREITRVTCRSWNKITSPAAHSCCVSGCCCWMLL